MSENPRVTSSNSRATSSILRVASSNARVTSSNPRVTSSNSRVTCSNPQSSTIIYSTKTQVNSLKISSFTKTLSLRKFGNPWGIPYVQFLVIIPHCVKSVQIWSYLWSVFGHFSRSACVLFFHYFMATALAGNKVSKC